MSIGRKYHSRFFENFVSEFLKKFEFQEETRVMPNARYLLINKNDCNMRLVSFFP